MSGYLYTFLLLAAVIGIMGQAEGSSEGNNSSIYRNILIQALTQYDEDLNSSSYILDEFVKKNISSNDAMIATTSLFILASHTLETIEFAKLPLEYEDYHNDTIRALEYLREYLWDMAKFYETNEIGYAFSARDNFNSSLYYYEKGKNLLKMGEVIEPQKL
ncbi:MAG: hypothetical protein GYA39_06760 [Methanothrix sp.]|nr:hypothetical protein [Methanothrix sp.]